MEVFDYKRDGNNNLVIANGDFVRAESTLQHQNSLMIAEKGDYKQFPTIGVAIRTQLLNDAHAEEIRTEIQKEFEGDGMRIGRIVIESLENIEINAQYGDPES